MHIISPSNTGRPHGSASIPGGTYPDAGGNAKGVSERICLKELILI
jgi:hypothetical protein